jgi:hypothetical protein
MDNADEVLTLKRMVLDLNRMICRTWKNGLASSEMDLEQAMDRVRATVERVTGCNDIPLEWYEWTDESFVGQVEAFSLNKKK